MLLHVWLKLDLWFWGSKSFLIFCFYKFLISVIISPVGMYCPSFEYSLHDTFCSLVEISHVVLAKIFKSCQCIFAILLASICPWLSVWPFTCLLKNIEYILSLYPRMLRGSVVLGIHDIVFRIISTSRCICTFINIIIYSWGKRMHWFENGSG